MQCFFTAIFVTLLAQHRKIQKYFYSRAASTLALLESERAAFHSSKGKSFLENTCAEMGWKQQLLSYLIQRLCLLEPSAQIQE